VEEAEGFFLSQGAVFLDTRDERAYASAHIQSAKNLPWGDFDAEYETILEGVEKDDFIICYCDGADCNSSEHVAIALLERGYSNVYVLFGGWSLWQQRNLPIEGVNDLFSK
jgi:rhodanese-related sulfurtransferase